MDKTDKMVAGWFKTGFILVLGVTLGMILCTREVTDDAQRASVLNSFMCCNDYGYCSDTLYRIKTNDCLMTMDGSTRESRFIKR